jgi:hypothetical protein
MKKEKGKKKKKKKKENNQKHIYIIIKTKKSWKKLLKKVEKSCWKNKKTKTHDRQAALQCVVCVAGMWRWKGSRDGWRRLVRRKEGGQWARHGGGRDGRRWDLRGYG